MRGTPWRLIASSFRGTGAYHPATIAAVCVPLIVVALGTFRIPARRVDPIVALRYRSDVTPAAQLSIPSMNDCPLQLKHV